MSYFFSFIIFNLISLFLCSNDTLVRERRCAHSVTTVSGTHIPKHRICRGALIFEDHFNHFDLSVWAHERLENGGGNGEFQWYTNSRDISYTKNGKLYIHPKLIGARVEDESVDFSVFDNVTSGAELRSQRVNSARIRTINSFAFKYGTVEVRAKIPTGDWIWPAIWFMPKRSVYGTWPTSGEIDLMESRGNEHLTVNGRNIGVERIGSTLHFGPNPQHNAWPTSAFEKNRHPGWNDGFHSYKLEWTPSHLKFSVDNSQIGFVPVGSGFWNRGGFGKTGLRNPWPHPGSPFDQEFYLILNVAIGGNFFPDNGANPGGKPWRNGSPNAVHDFWRARHTWFKTWYPHTSRAAMEVDYVKVWAV